MNVLAGVIALAVVVEYLVEGLKQAAPSIKNQSQERLAALVFALALMLALPYIKVVDLGVLGALTWAESILIAVLISRGSSAIHGLLEKLGVTK